MLSSAEHYRREARLLEQAAEQISFQPDKKEILSEAQSLRRRADEIEAWSAASAAIGPMPPERPS